MVLASIRLNISKSAASLHSGAAHRANAIFEPCRRARHLLTHAVQTERIGLAHIFRPLARSTNTTVRPLVSSAVPPEEPKADTAPSADPTKAPVEDAETSADGSADHSEKSGPEHADPADMDDATIRVRLLDAALDKVPEHGWTVGALSAAAVSIGLSPAAHGMLARGPIELVRHFSSACDAKLQAELVSKADEFESLEVKNRLVLAMQTRLRMLEPYVATWPQALALKAQPTNVSESLSDAHALASLLLDACGAGARAPIAPAAIDAQLKCASLAAVYGAAELYMLTDKSPGFSDTWLFVEREVGALHSLVSFNPAAAIGSVFQRRS